MNTKKKRFVPKKRLIKHFLSLTLAGSLLLPGLVLIQPKPVEASFVADMASGVVGKLRYSATVAEIIVSLMTGSGASVTNTNWLNQINTSYGVNSTLATATGTDGTIGAMYEAGLFSIDSAGHYIDNGLSSAISSQPAYTSAGIDTLFETTATDMELGAWQTADAATNIGEAASAGIATGSIGSVFGAVALGVNLGILANKVANMWGQKMATKQYINSTRNVPVGKKYAGIVFSSGTSYVYYAPYNSNSYYYVSGGRYYTNPCVMNKLSSSDTMTVVNTDSSGHSSTSTTTLAVGSTGTGYNSWGIAPTTLENFQQITQSQATAITQAANSGSLDINLPYSPDIVGPAGNQRPISYTENITNPTNWPDLKPSEQLQNDDIGIKPIPWNDYTQQVQTFNNNTTNDNTTVNQGDTYNNFIENYYVTPEQITDIPNVETPDYNPTVPEQPTPNPKEELTSEVVQDNTDYMTTPGLKDVFPFSIPWDIAGLFNIFSTNNREAPVITFPIVSELFGIDEEITIDLSPYDGVASLLRLLELIAFGLGLAFVTRYLIGAGG